MHTMHSLRVLFFTIFTAFVYEARGQKLTCYDSAGIEALPVSGYKNKTQDGPETLQLDAANMKEACWANYDASQNMQNEELDYVFLPDAKKLADENCQEKDTGIEAGPAIGLYSPVEKDLKSGGAMHSCPITCSQGPPKVTVSGAKAGDVKWQLCTATAFKEDPEFEDCVDVEPGKPVTVGKESKDPKKLYEIVLHAFEFKEKDFVIFNKIKVEFEACPSESGAEKAVACDFANDTCGYKPDTEDSKAQDGIEFKRYEAKETIVGNLDTGVNAVGYNNKAAENPIVAKGPFLATPLNPGDKVVSSSTIEPPLEEDVEIKFQVYEACKDNQAKICLDTLDKCVFETEKGVTVEDRKWKEGTATITKDTKKILLVAENTGSVFGAVGFSNIEIVKK